MATKGRRTPARIEKFVLETREAASKLTYSQIADRVAGEFGEVNGIDKSTVANILKRELRQREKAARSHPAHDARADSTKDQTTGPNPELGVSGWTDREGRNIKPHRSASMTTSISILFSIVNHGAEMIRYLRFHVWLPLGFHWSFEVPYSSTWEPQAEGELPDERLRCGYKEGFERWVLHLPPERGFFLPPNGHPFELPPIVVQRRPIDGPLPVPWKVESFGAATEVGTLMLWFDRKTAESTILRSELATDRKDLQRVEAEVRSWIKQYGGVGPR